MELLMIRHSSTRGNLLRQYVGSQDHPLAPEGVEQLQPGEEGHIDIQHRQIGGVLLQPGQVRADG